MTTVTFTLKYIVYQPEQPGTISKNKPTGLPTVRCIDSAGQHQTGTVSSAAINGFKSVAICHNDDLGDVVFPISIKSADDPTISFAIQMAQELGLPLASKPASNVTYSISEPEGWVVSVMTDVVVKMGDSTSLYGSSTLPMVLRLNVQMKSGYPYISTTLVVAIGAAIAVGASQGCGIAVFPTETSPHGTGNSPYIPVFNLYSIRYDVYKHIINAGTDDSAASEAQATATQALTAANDAKSVANQANSIANSVAASIAADGAVSLAIAAAKYAADRASQAAATNAEKIHDLEDVVGAHAGDWIPAP